MKISRIEEKANTLVVIVALLWRLIPDLLSTNIPNCQRHLHLSSLNGYGTSK